MHAHQHVQALGDHRPRAQIYQICPPKLITAAMLIAAPNGGYTREP